MSFVFVTGGARSGKSDYAMSLAEKAGGRLVYIATATPGDDEMRERIENHRRSRGMNWKTIEETLDLSGAVSSLGGEDATVVIDCLTLWLTNLMMQDMEAFEDVAIYKARELADALRGLDAVHAGQYRLAHARRGRPGGGFLGSGQTVAAGRVRSLAPFDDQGYPFSPP